MSGEQLVHREMNLFRAVEGQFQSPLIEGCFILLGFLDFPALNSMFEEELAWNREICDALLALAA